MNGVRAVSFDEMCRRQGRYLQRGMYFRDGRGGSVILISEKNEASYKDVVAPDGEFLIYTGHNAHRSRNTPLPQLVDQPERHRSGTLTQNGRFAVAAERYRGAEAPAEPVQVYKKLHHGVWLDIGVYHLVDGWKESDGRRSVYKFKLRRYGAAGRQTDRLPEPRRIPADVRADVWNRDKGRCVVCGAADDLHFDHIVPVSKGGNASAKNIQLLCSKHNLLKSNSI